MLLVPSTAPETIEQYSIRVAENWKLGRKGVDDGVLLLVAVKDHALRIEVGYGLEGALPDALSLAASSVHAVLAHARSDTARDIPLVAAQDVLRDPPVCFPAETVNA